MRTRYRGWKLDAAKEFLRHELASGAWVGAAAIFDKASQAGIAVKTLKRARVALGVDTRQANRRWVLRLAPPPQPIRSCACPSPLISEEPEGRFCVKCARVAA